LKVLDSANSICCWRDRCSVLNQTEKRTACNYGLMQPGSMATIPRD